MIDMSGWFGTTLPLVSSASTSRMVLKPALGIATLPWQLLQYVVSVAWAFCGAVEHAVAAGSLLAGGLLLAGGSFTCGGLLLLLLAGGLVGSACAGGSLLVFGAPGSAHGMLGVAGVPSASFGFSS